MKGFSPHTGNQACGKETKTVKTVEQTSYGNRPAAVVACRHFCASLNGHKDDTDKSLVNGLHESEAQFHLY